MADETEQTNDQQVEQQTQQTDQQVQDGTGSQPGNQARPSTPDRSNWIPPHRFNEVNTGYQTERQRAAALEQQLYQATQRIQALAGVQQVAPEDLQREEVRAALIQVFPALGKLNDDMIDRLVGLAEQGEQLQDTNRTIWRNHGTRMINTAQGMVSDKLRVDSLSDSQQKRIAREYVFYVKENAGNGAVERHEAGDETLVQEFVDSFLADWQDSVRQSVVSQELGNRRPVPSGRGRSIGIGSSKKKINYSNDKDFGDAAVQAFLDHGGGFGS